MRSIKSEEIKIRIEPIKKLALQQIADSECLDMSDMARRAINDMIKRYTKLKKAA